jgi:hypothetical protein
MSMDEGLEKLTLATVADGHLEEQFEERLDEARDIFSNSRRYEEDAGKKQVVVIVAEVAIEFDTETRARHVEARAFIKKRPGPKKIRRICHERPEGLMVKPEIQETLPMEQESVGDH